MARKEFSKKIKQEALKRSEGKCEAVGIMYGLKEGQRCNAPLSMGAQFDHIVRACDGGDNALDNCAAVCIKCHGWKTRKFDTPQAAKTKRMANKHTGVSRPAGKIKSQGFATGKRKPTFEKKHLPARQIYGEAK